MTASAQRGRQSSGQTSAGRTYDVIVVGVGAMGAAACYQLARRGVRVLGLEQFDIPHRLGSSGGHLRIIRTAYYEHPDYVPLLQRAYDAWDVLGAAAGAPILERTGALFLGAPQRDFIARSVDAAQAHGLPYEMWDERQVRDHWGQFRVPAHFAAMYEPSAGFLRCERAIGAFAIQAMQRGAVLHGRTAVRAWHADAHGVEVTTDRGTYHAGHLVFTTGAWTDKIVTNLPAALTITRQVTGWVWPRQPDHFACGRFPCWAVEDDAPGSVGLYYGFPMTAEQPGMRVGHHAPGPEVAPDTLDRTLTSYQQLGRQPDQQPDEQHSFRPALAKYLPQADGPLLGLDVCMYTNSPDYHFLIDSHTSHDNVVVACGFSGHGFKFAPVIGEAVANLVTGTETPVPIGFLSGARFTDS